MRILKDVEYTMNAAEIRRRLGLGSESSEWGDVQELMREMEGIIQPGCAYRACVVRSREQEKVVIEDVGFSSKVLAKNLEEVHRVFPFVVTLGQEVDDTLRREGDFLRQYYLDIIANVALQDVIKSLCAHVQEEYKLEKLSSMSPGSLQDWPIEEQRPLFHLLGSVEEDIGVRLEPSMLMYPSKSESGIFFPTEVTFFNCQLCPLENCPSRKAAFDEDKAREYGVL